MNETEKFARKQNRVIHAESPAQCIGHEGLKEWVTQQENKK